MLLTKSMNFNWKSQSTSLLSYTFQIRICYIPQYAKFSWKWVYTVVCKLNSKIQVLSVQFIMEIINSRSLWGEGHLPTEQKTFFSFFFFFFLRAAPAAYGSSQAWSRIRAAATGLCHSCSNTGSKPYLRPMPCNAATPAVQPTEWGQGSNPNPHGYCVGFLTAEPQWELLSRRHLNWPGSSCHGSAVTNPTNIHENVGLIPGLAQWVKHLALLHAMV